MTEIQVKGEVRFNGDGVRGLFATEDIAESEAVMRIPPEAIMSTGSSFKVRSVLLVWKFHTLRTITCSERGCLE